MFAWVLPAWPEVKIHVKNWQIVLGIAYCISLYIFWIDTAWKCVSAAAAVWMPVQEKLICEK